MYECDELFCNPDNKIPKHLFSLPTADKQRSKQV